ncbi:putative DMT superfamily transporter inner membrane protein [Photorhabdus australis subsp. thailandensis]|uniref:Threonine/homoserine exporter RhtA n=2 Tax=Photorhabdus australis TaxID=286156 RepID=A0A1C0U2Z9_9GAMM|nr:DMT family transporter [Photorhabdus australis]OCQ52246.1 putative DMT superfamily transporter inner membrane protein [Photorhabdus australis subsp. thailandensis]
MRVTPQLAVILTLFATFFWGSNFQATKLALSSLPPWTASVERFVFAVLAIFIFMVLKGGIHGKVLRQNLFAFISLGTIGVAGFNGALFVGLQSSSPVTAALIMATTPISANILEAIMNRRFPELIRVYGMMISLFGVALVITNGQLFSGGAIHTASGDLIILAGSLGWAIYTVGTRTFVTGATPLETTSWTMLFGTVILAIIAIFIESPVPSLFSGKLESHLASVYMGIAGSVFAYLFWNIGIATRGPGRTAIFFNFVPIFALGIQVAMGDIPSLAQIIGIIITISGVLLGQGVVTLRFISKGLPAK